MLVPLARRRRLGFWHLDSPGRRFLSILAPRRPVELDQADREQLDQLLRPLRNGRPAARLDTESYRTILRLCANLHSLVDAKFIHQHLVSVGLDTDTNLVSSIVYMYGRCGRAGDAQQAFDRARAPSVLLWDSLLTAYGVNGHFRQIIAAFREMQLEGKAPAATTLHKVLNACTQLGDVAQARHIYSTIAAVSHLANDDKLNRALLNSFAKCGFVMDAQLFFNRISTRDVFVWTILVSAYAQNGYLDGAITSLGKMLLDGVRPNKVTFTAILPVTEGRIDVLRRLHAWLSEDGLDKDIIMGTTLVDMYTKCSSLVEARHAFEAMETSDVVSWTAMIGSYVRYGDSREALHLFKTMQLEGVHPNPITFLLCVNACSGECIQQGRLLHKMAVAGGFLSEVRVGNALINMYGNCGIVGLARSVFDMMGQRDESSWNSLITAFAQHGESSWAIDLFWEMQQDGEVPDYISFVGVLCACSSAGMLDEGRGHFLSMVDDFGAVAKMEHYGCIVDLFTKVGWLEEAEELIVTMPFVPDDIKWNSLLSACRMYGDIGRGGRAAEGCVAVSPEDSSPYTLMSSIYTENDEL